MNKKFLFVLALLFSFQARADMCDTAAAIAAEQGLAKAVLHYESCALDTNNDAAEFLLAGAYETGGQGISKNTQKALLFYHLSAENGNAKAQRALAKLLLKLDETPKDREQVQAYLSKMHAAYKNAPSDEFKGELLHPYTLLLLAAEKPDAKWYYPSDVTISDEAGADLRAYKISDAKRVQALKDASAWKQKKMMQAAKELYSSADYESFKNAVAPARGKADVFTKNQAIAKLQKAVKEFRGQ